ncbi:NAC transcription factor NAM-2-like [Alnus glutinosa]|uniref:NAC transcription factor NAM-2-like n=1 Tax=Alnus glutinosa TaxID=3517 RepID=UPI002D78D944|nr:NAC transcription factor NAM-2-like [Alnus glutinosa]
MHEYRINNPPPPTGDNDMRLDDWVLCRMYKKINKARTQEEEEEVRVGESASTTALPNNIGEEEEVRAGESGATTALSNNGAQPGAVLPSPNDGLNSDPLQLPPLSINK